MNLADQMAKTAERAGKRLVKKKLNAEEEERKERERKLSEFRKNEAPKVFEGTMKEIRKAARQGHSGAKIAYHHSDWTAEGNIIASMLMSEGFKASCKYDTFHDGDIGFSEATWLEVSWKVK